MEAHTLLTLLDLRTTEQLYVAEGMAQKTDISFGGGGYRGAITPCVMTKSVLIPRERVTPTIEVFVA